MAEIVLAIIAKLSEYLVDPTVRQGQYLFCAGKITKSLETEKLRLASAQDRVEKRVQEALHRTEKIDDAVQKWLDEVKNHMGELQKLEQQMNEDGNCFQGKCPNLKRYQLCRKMAKKTVATKNLIPTREFNPFSVPAPLPGIEYFSSGNFVYFQCTLLASNELLAALQDEGSHRIGLYGMGGSGKTTLIKEVGRKAKELKLFDQVVFTTVSQTPNIRKIQGEIADMLSLELREETENGRARHLSMRLSSGERILMILDDVWAKINLKDIGIPFEDYHVGCKVLLTTRRQQVCNLMDCEKKIPLHLLSEEESWTLFQKHAHIVDNSITNVAKEIARKCKGLPIAIEALGTSLKGRSIEEWKEALMRLRDAKPVTVEQGVNDAFACLRLSYNYLNTKEAKSLFLICSMYPEDEDIFVEDLFRIATGSGLCEEVGSLERARYKVTTSINNLIDSCLLMRSEKKKNHLRMHDTIREVALWIASTENHTIVVNPEKDLLAEQESIKDCYALTSLWNETSQIPQQLDAPKLEILLLKTESSFELSETIFTRLEALKVMGIVPRDFRLVKFLTSLPQPMNLLTNLRTLRLERCKLGHDWSWVLGLKKLEILDLKHCKFEELPNGLKELTKLKLLDLSSCVVKEQSYEAVERCTQLEELYVSGIQLSRSTLKHGKCSSKNVAFPILQRYELQIGSFESITYSQRVASMDFSTKALYLGKLNISASSPFIKDVLQRAEAVCLHNLYEGGKNIVPDIIQVVGCMNELTSLWLHFYSSLECLVDGTSHHVDLFQAETLFPKLTKLRLEILANLKQIWCGPPLIGFFEKLQELEIANCPLLTSLFPKCVARALLLLQKLTIRACGELKNIIEGDGTGIGNEITPTSISNNSSLVFSQLKSLTIRDCVKLEHVFSNSCVQGLVQLEEVSISRASQLNYVFGHHEDEHHEFHIELPVLEFLNLWSLKNLVSVFPKNFHSSCPSLKELVLGNCPKFTASCINIMDNQLYSEALASLSFLNLKKLLVEHCNVEGILFSLEGVVFANTDPQSKLISTLDTLNLDNLSELEFVWSGPVQTLSLQNLIDFKVDRCNNLKTIFSPVILRSMQLLENLNINDCNELEEIISDSKVEEQHQNPLNVQSPCNILGYTDPETAHQSQPRKQNEALHMLAEK